MNCAHVEVILLPSGTFEMFEYCKVCDTFKSISWSNGQRQTKSVQETQYMRDLLNTKLARLQDQAKEEEFYEKHIKKGANMSNDPFDSDKTDERLDNPNRASEVDLAANAQGHDSPINHRNVTDTSREHLTGEDTGERDDKKTESIREVKTREADEGNPYPHKLRGV